MAFFIFLFSLLNANFIHTNIFLYTNSYTNFVTSELCLRNGLAGINHSVQWENKLTLLHKDFDFSKNAGRNFNFILSYTVFTLISIIHKSFKKKSRQNFPFYSIIFLTFDYFKASFRVEKFRSTISTKEIFHKRFFFLEVLDLFYHLHDSYHHYQRLLYCHLCAEIQKLANLNFTLLLSDNISLNPGPTPNSVSQSI